MRVFYLTENLKTLDKIEKQRESSIITSSQPLFKVEEKVEISPCQGDTNIVNMQK